MAKPAPKDSELPTVKAVVKYAAQLRDQAAKARERDPNVELYAPSEDAARKESQKQCQIHGKELGPQKALEALARRALDVELKLGEEATWALHGRRRHLIHQSVSAGEREATLSRLSLGQRLDQALLALGLTSEARIAQLDADRVTGSRSTGLPRTGDEHGGAYEKALGLIVELERDAEFARRRLVEGVVV